MPHEQGSVGAEGGWIVPDVEVSSDSRRLAPARHARGPVVRRPGRAPRHARLRRAGRRPTSRPRAPTRPGAVRRAGQSRGALRGGARRARGAGGDGQHGQGGRAYDECPAQPRRPARRERAHPRRGLPGERPVDPDRSSRRTAAAGCTPRRAWTWSCPRRSSSSQPSRRATAGTSRSWSRSASGQPVPAMMEPRQFHEIVELLAGHLHVVAGLRPARRRSREHGQPRADPAGRPARVVRGRAVGAPGHRPRPRPGHPERAHLRARARAGHRAPGAGHLQEPADRDRLPRAEESAHDRGRPPGDARVRHRGHRRGGPTVPGRDRARVAADVAGDRGPAAAPQDRRVAEAAPSGERRPGGAGARGRRP